MHKRPLAAAAAARSRRLCMATAASSAVAGATLSAPAAQHRWRQEPRPAAELWGGRQRRAAPDAGGPQNRTTAELPPGAKSSAGGNFVSVRGRCSVLSAPLQ